MIDFLISIKYKLARLFAVIFFGLYAISLVIYFVVLIFGKGKVEPIGYVLLYSTLFAFAMSAFMILGIFGFAYFTFRLRKATLSNPPFDELENMGFVKVQFLEKTWIYQNEDALLKIVNGFPIVIRFAAKNLVEVAILVQGADRLRKERVHISQGIWGQSFPIGYSLLFEVGSYGYCSPKEFIDLLTSHTQQLTALGFEAESQVTTLNNLLINEQWQRSLSGLT